jgi:Uncharacterized protein conserved in bacteria
MKIEIGCGLKPHKGYKTIDVEEYAKPDYLGDFRTMSFENLEEIRSHHLLEHFSREEAIKIIDTWYGWLSLGGKLIIETPDIEGICEQFSKITGKKKDIGYVDTYMVHKREIGLFIEMVGGKINLRIFSHHMALK